jgi:hypothetical protein
MDVAPVARNCFDVFSAFQVVKEFKRQEQWLSAIDKLTEVLCWDWPIKGCSDDIQFRLQDHLVECFYALEDYPRMEIWARIFLERREKFQPDRSAGQTWHSKRTLYLRRELANSIQLQYELENDDTETRKAHLNSAIALLESNLNESRSENGEVLLNKEVLAKCYSKMENYEKSAELCMWIINQKSAQFGDLDEGVFETCYDLAQDLLMSLKDGQGGITLFKKTLSIIKHNWEGNLNSNAPDNNSEQVLGVLDLSSDSDSDSDSDFEERTELFNTKSGAKDEL